MTKPRNGAVIMAEDIQGFLDRIRTEGIEKADEEKAKIIADAKAEAEKIVAEAKQKAQAVAEEAARQAKLSEEKGNAALKQAARDVLIGLKEEILRRLQAIVKEYASSALTVDTMKQVILAAAKAQDADGQGTLEVLVDDSLAGKLAVELGGALVADLKKRPVIRAGGGIGNGLQIGFTDSDVYLDFTDEALAELICAYAGPRITAVLKG